MQIIESGDNIGLGLNPETTYNGLTSAELAQVHEKTYNTTIYAPSEEQVQGALENVAKPLMENFISSCLEQAGFKKAW